MFPAGQCRGERFRIDDEVGLDELAGPSRRLGLGGYLRADRFDRDAGVAIAISGVAEHLADRHTRLPGGVDQPGGLGAVGHVGRGGRHCQDQLVVVIGEHVRLVAIDPLGGALATMTHVGIDHRDDPVTATP